MAHILRPQYCLIVDPTINQPHVREGLDIEIDDGIITSIHPRNPSADADTVYELPHHILLPGLINTHNHTAMTLFRGFADDYQLQEWLEQHIWPMEAKLNQELVYAGAKFAAIEQLMSGTTAVNSMYWYPEGEITAFLDVGVRLMVGPPIISGNTSLTGSDNLIRTYHGKNGDMTRISLNPHAPYTVTAEDYQEVHAYKEQYNAKSSTTTPLKLHTHLAESPIEFDLITSYAQQQGFVVPDQSSSPVQYLDQLGILDTDTIAAHVVECSPEDVKILQQREVGLSANVTSNMKLGNNIPHLDLMTQNYQKLGFGTDGPSSNNNLDMFETMKFATLAVKSMMNNPTLLPASQVLDIATRGGAQTLGWEGMGEIKVGNYADLIAVDLNKPHLRPISSHQSIISHLVYSANGADVSHTMIHGKWKMINRELVDYDLIAVLDEFDQITTDFFS